MSTHPSDVPRCSEALTDDEREAMRLSGELASLGFRIIGNGRTREQDCDEWAIRIHAVQHMIMAQAAARAYPDQFRLLGGVAGLPKSSHGEERPGD